MSKNTNKNRLKKVVCVGGGTGTFVVLSGLKKYQIDLSVIVAMADSGGSNRIIRDEFGLLPTSDIRQCLVALADANNDSEDLLKELFKYRFHQGEGIKGNTFGNLFMAALSDILGSQEEAIKKTGQILKIKGKILPVTLTNSNLVAIYENGKRVVGEHFIDEPEHDGRIRIEKVFLEPKSQANPETVNAILKADLIVFGPGDLYTSLIVNLLSDGIVEALEKTKAKIVFVLNLMTRYGQTFNYSAKDHIKDIEKYLGKNLDFVLVNSKKIKPSVLKSYKKNNEFSVEDNLNNDYFKVVRDDLLSEKETKKVVGDVLGRSLICHDSDKLAKAIMDLI